MNKAGTPLLSIGIIFLISGFVAQDFSFRFENGMFILGFIFTLSGLTSVAMKNKDGDNDD